MPFNLDHIKIPTFANINDTPRLPTSSRGGNGSHLIAKFNEFIDESVYAFNNFEINVNSQNDRNNANANAINNLIYSSSKQYKVTDVNYCSIDNQDKAFININDSDFIVTVTFKAGNVPESGEYFSIINKGVTVRFNTNNLNFNASSNVGYVSFTQVNQEILFIWIDENTGFYSPQIDLLTIVLGDSSNSSSSQSD